MVGTYRVFKLPKKAGGYRKICAPDESLKAYQRSKLRPLVQEFLKQAHQHDVLEMFHGFLPGRSPITAAKRHVGYRATLTMDLSAFFDTVTKEMVSKVSNKTLTKDSAFYTKEGFTSQGFATSPILANLSVIPLMKELKAAFPAVVITIYADDLSFSSNQHDMKALSKEVSGVIQASPFILNESKTRIKYAVHGYRRILGVNVGNTGVRATRSVMKRIRAARHQEQWSSLCGLSNWATCPEPAAGR